MKNTIKIKKAGKFSTTSKVLDFPLGAIKGLMFSKKPKPSQSVLLKFPKEKIYPIHMLFVFFPIDAIWINSKHQIVHIERNIKPFTPHINPKTKASYILETTKNATKNLKIGDKLKIN
tara:strand:- start:103 stop:456 length:354 start_codon:yes stop_codon:yes gene_type:complete